MWWHCDLPGPLTSPPAWRCVFRTAGMQDPADLVLPPSEYIWEQWSSKKQNLYSLFKKCCLWVISIWEEKNISPLLQRDSRSLLNGEKFTYFNNEYNFTRKPKPRPRKDTENFTWNVTSWLSLFSTNKHACSMAETCFPGPWKDLCIVSTEESV